MKSIKPNKPKAMIVFYKILFPVREKRSAAVSLFPFRQISEFPTGAALLKAAEFSRHCRLVYVTYRKVSEGRSFRMPYRKLGGTAVELSSLCTFVQRDFLCHRKLGPRKLGPMTQKTLRRMQFNFSRAYRCADCERNCYKVI